jgi:tryptophanyl-tRNA synthetase
MNKKVILTGDRPTGNLHLGHYVGSLENRVKLQDIHQQYIMIADVQALTDNFNNPQKVKDNIFEVAKDYLAVGIDPDKTTIFLQSQITEIAELTIYYLNLVTLGRLERNPTVKSEIQQKGFSDSIPVGFLCYPVSQAADITILKAELVPVGEDQLPMIEQTNEIVRRFNRIYNVECLKEAEAILSNTKRLVGIDGKEKAGKSLGNAIFLSDTSDEIKRKVYSMFTDPDHLRVSDPGKVEGNVVFAYLDAFHQDKDEVVALKEHYQKGGLGDSVIKGILNKSLQNLIAPIRQRRQEIKDEYLKEIIADGTRKVRKIAGGVIEEVRNAMGIMSILKK